MPPVFPVMSATWPWAKTEEWPQSVRCVQRWVNACSVWGGWIDRDGCGGGFNWRWRAEIGREERLTGFGAEEVTSMVREKQEVRGV